MRCSGIALATVVFLRRRELAEATAARLPAVYRTLLNKYYVDEAYDATVVHPVQRVSERVLWRTIDAGVIDGTVNGAGAFVRGGAALLRRWMKKHVGGARITRAVIDRLEAAADPKREGVEICAEWMREIAAIPGVGGIHLMSMGSPESIKASIVASGLR